MPKALITFLLSIIFFGAGIDHSYGAFPIKKEAPAATQDETPALKKPFKESKVSKLVSQVKHAVYPHPDMHGDSQKPGWQGIVSFICALLAIGCLFSIALVPFSLLFAIMAIIFGAIGLSPRRHTNTGLALAGMIIGVVEILLFVAVIAIIASVLT